MPVRATSHVVKVTGISDDLIRLVDATVSARHYRGRAEYIRELIRKDLAAATGIVNGNQATKNLAEATAVFAEITKLNLQVEQLSPDADTREAIYGDRGL